MKQNEKKNLKNRKDNRKYCKVLRVLTCTSLVILLLVFVCVPSFAISSDVVGDYNGNEPTHYSSRLPVDTVYTALYADDSTISASLPQPAFYSDFENHIYCYGNIPSDYNITSRFVVNRGAYSVRSFATRQRYYGDVVQNSVYFGDSSYQSIPSFYNEPYDLRSYHFGFCFSPFTYCIDNSLDGDNLKFENQYMIRYIRPASLGDDRVSVGYRVLCDVQYSGGKEFSFDEILTYDLINGYSGDSSDSAIYSFVVSADQIITNILRENADSEDVDSERFLVNNFAIYIDNDFFNETDDVGIDPYIEDILFSSFHCVYTPVVSYMSGVRVDELPYESVSYPTYIDDSFSPLDWLLNVVDSFMTLSLFETAMGLPVTLGAIASAFITIVIVVAILKMYFGG